MNYYLLGILILFLSGFISLIFKNEYRTKILSFFCVVSSIFCSIPAIKVLFEKNPITTEFYFNPLFGNVILNIDNLSAFFILLISLISLPSIIYSNGYLKPYIEKGKNISTQIVFLPLLLASMLLVVSVSNAFMFLVCWEIMSLSSFFLVVFETEKKEILKAGIKYLVFMHVSILFIIFAFVLCSLNANSYNFSDFASVLVQNKEMANIVFILAFIGFGLKAGFVPFHNWLPDAHPAAPSHVSAIMSGIMIKTGIYGILRILSLIKYPSLTISYFVLLIALVSVLYGLLYAISQRDLKKLLAYSSIENIGIIGLGIGVGMLGVAYSNNIVAVFGFMGSIFHILNHSIFKQLLFLSAGSVYIKTHTRDMELLGGLIKTMPKTSILFIVASVAICGLPPLNGFISEFLIYFGMLKGLEINNFFEMVVILFSVAGLSLVGTMAILCFSKATSIVFLGLPRSENSLKVESDNGKTIILPMLFLALASLVIGLYPQALLNILSGVMLVLTNLDTNILDFGFVSLLQNISLISFGFLTFLSVLIFIKLKLSKKVSVHNTWGCGYNKPNNHMQYSASSYINPFTSMLKPLFKNIFDIEKPKHLFPKSAHFNLQVNDIEEAYFINPLVKFDEWFLAKFETMQSGNIQSYIKYGLIFLILIIIGSLFIG
ncbi:MAG: hypothetical protein E7Z91_02655 [Cyanobacteria bacterium SIG30]|nr:hypothetical protein [Cyanobacteria bacterium SIG30]